MLKKFKLLKKNEPWQYAKGIKKMVKGSIANPRKKRSGCQKAELIKTVEAVCRFKEMSRDEGCILLDKEQYFGHMMTTRRWSTTKCKLGWKEAIKKEYTEKRNGKTVVAVQKAVELNTRDGLRQERKKGSYGQCLQQEDDRCDDLWC